ncbi:NAD(P)-binding protein [Gracilibacillus marinus]|uniref:precorrin-2 dehydrogenase n=1 Tax=Gracilibacillus marinus TaxID=630535 RepID=A0ABV8VS01_9BACI
MGKIPFMIDLTNKNIVIVGGGKVAERRLLLLKDQCASITVISETITEEIENYIDNTSIYWYKRPFRDEDIIDTDFVIIATNDKKVNEHVINVTPKHVLLNAAHNANEGNIEFMKTVKRGLLQVGIHTGGASPTLAKKLYHDIEASFPSDYSDYVDFLYEVRQLIKLSPLENMEKHALLKEMVDCPIYDKEEQALFILQLKKKIEHPRSTK